MRFGVIAVPFLMKHCSRRNIHVKRKIYYIKFIHTLWSLSVVLSLLECSNALNEFALLQKLTSLIQQHWSRHGKRRTQCRSGNANSWCSQELEEVWGHIQTAFWIWYGRWSRNVKDEGKTDFSPRNVWIKIVWEINFNPSWKSTLHFPLLEIKSALQRTLREEGFTSCRPRKALLL